MKKKEKTKNRFFRRFWTFPFFSWRSVLVIPLRAFLLNFFFTVSIQTDFSFDTHFLLSIFLGFFFSIRLWFVFIVIMYFFIAPFDRPTATNDGVEVDDDGTETKNHYKNERRDKWKQKK